MSQRHRIAFVLMIVGVAIYAVFHLWQSGWKTWPAIIGLLAIPEYWSFDIAAAICAFACLPIPVVGAPICLPLLSRSRLLRFMMAGFAIFGAFAFFILWMNSFGKTCILLAIAPLFTLSGLLIIKPVQHPDILGN